VATLGFYRYISDPNEVVQWSQERKINTLNPKAVGTWYAPTRYQTPDQAESELALPIRPTHRAGPIPADEMPDFVTGPRLSQPLFGQPGGGIEVLVGREAWIFGFRDFAGMWVP
jgi:hypothetical protein